MVEATKSRAPGVVLCSDALGWHAGAGGGNSLAPRVCDEGGATDPLRGRASSRASGSEEQEQFLISSFDRVSVSALTGLHSRGI